MEQHYRKPLRLDGWDYSSNGYYFVTICTHQKQTLLGSVQRFVGARHDSPPAHTPQISLSPYGVVVNDVIQSIPEHFPNVSVDQYVIMPNHIHIIIVISDREVSHSNHASAGASHASPLRNQSVFAKVVGYLKAVSSKWIHRLYHCDHTIWQRGSYDHIIRTEADYLRITRYIHDNPANWTNDDYYKG